MLRGLVALTLLSACSPSVRKCADKTVLLAVTLAGNAAQADLIEIDLTIGNEMTVTRTVPHTPGEATGNLQVEFPSGYPRNSVLQVHLKAIAGSMSLGVGGTVVILRDACELATVTVTDLPDLGAGDFSAVGDSAIVEMGEDVDLGVVPDLTPPPVFDFMGPPPDLAGIDLNGCVPVTENCFNGMDEDCDGLVDCLDPDCTGGLGAKAVCVPPPQSFTLGITVGGGSCPTAWPTMLTLFADMNATCGAGSCGCGMPSTPKCEASIYNYGSDSTCTTPVETVLTGYVDGTCYPLSIPGGGAYHALGPLTWVGDCGSPMGAAAKQAAFATTDSFCSGATSGSGCNANFVCVPTASNHCVVAAGAGQSCPSGYQPRGKIYYTGFDDSTRSCSCSCPATPGACDGTPVATIFSGDGCSGLSFPGGLGCNNVDVAGFPSGHIDGVTATSPTCGFRIDESGAVMLQGARTICCVP